MFQTIPPGQRLINEEEEEEEEVEAARVRNVHPAVYKRVTILHFDFKSYPLHRMKKVHVPNESNMLMLFLM